MRQSFVVSIFSFLLASCIGSIYWILRIGFVDNSILTVVRVLGVAAFILLFPIGFSPIRRYFSDVANKVFLNDTVLPVYACIIIALFGYLKGFLDFDLSPIFSVGGYLFLVIALKFLFTDLKLINNILLLLIAGFFSLWVGGVCWLWYLKPYILENWAYGTDKVDTLFHISLSQMIKTYGVPSTGLDGLPPMTYHWGSHWFFAQLSKFLNLSVTTVYQLCYSVVMAPLLFRTFLSFVLDVKAAYRPDKEYKVLNPVFWILFLSVFIGFFKSFFRGNTWAEYSTGGTGSTILMLISESYCLSIIVMLACLSLMLSFWRHRNHLSIGQMSFFVFFVLPAGLAILGIIKISTLFVVCGLLGYLFLRLKMFLSIRYVAALIVIFIIALLIFKVGFETKENHGGLSLFYFYRNYNISIPWFVFLFFIWTYIFLIVYTVKEKLYKKNFLASLRTDGLLPLESVLWVTFIAFFPSMVLRLQNYDSLYFSEIPMWIASALVLVYVPFYVDKTYPLKRILLVVILVTPVVYFLIINTKSYYGNIYAESVRHHHFVLNATGHETEGLRIRDLVKKTSLLSETDYSRSKVLSFLFKLKQLDKLPLQEKKKSLVYVDFRSLITRTDYQWRLGCHNIALIVPSLTGMAMIDGFDVTYYELCGGCCEQIEFLYGYYPKWKSRGQINTEQTIPELKEKVKNKGFENLIYFNLQTEKFEFIKV